MTATGRQLLAHLVGDYVLQSDWMAAEKTRRWAPALAHGATYAVPFVTLTRSPWRLVLIGGTHTIIDRYRLAKYVCWAKNQVAPSPYRYRWAEAGATGYGPTKPDWMAVWLMIIADNTLHALLNAAALHSGKRGDG